MTRDADIARIADVLRQYKAAFDRTFRSDTIDADAAALYDHGLRPLVEPRLTPENIDKFTDAQFTAFMQATGFDAGITEALAEVHAGDVPLWTDTPSVEPAGLDEAWKAAEAALPDEWSVWGLVGWPGDTPDQWRATAVQRGEGEDKPFVDGHGPTAKGALYALADNLRLVGGLLEDADRDRAVVSEWDTTLPLPESDE